MWPQAPDITHICLKARHIPEQPPVAKGKRYTPASSHMRYMEEATYTPSVPQSSGRATLFGRAARCSHGSLASAERSQGRRSRPVGTFRTAQLRLQTPQASGLSLLQNTEGVAAQDAVTASPRRKRRKGQYDADTVLLRVLLKREATGNRGSRLAPSASGLRGLSRPDRKGDGKTAAPATFRSVLPPHAFEWTCSCRPHGALRKGHNVAAPCT